MFLFFIEPYTSLLHILCKAFFNLIWLLCIYPSPSLPTLFLLFLLLLQFPQFTYSLAFLYFISTWSNHLNHSCINFLYIELTVYSVYCFFAVSNILSSYMIVLFLQVYKKYMYISVSLFY